jgi:hypothetical protein
MYKAFALCKDKFKVAQIGGWIFANARYLRKEVPYRKMLKNACRTKN